MSIPYYNRSAPFWDFVANLEDGAMNPSSSEDPRYRGGEGPFGHGASPWDWAWRGPWGRQSHPHHHPPPHPHGQDAVREGGEDDGTTTLVGDQDMTDGEKEKHEDNGVPTEERREKREGEKREGEKREGKKRECGGERREGGGERRGGCHGRRGGPHAHGGGRGRCEGGRGRGGPHFGFRRGPPGPWNMRGMAEQLFGGPQDAEGGHSRTNDDGVELFVPPVDVFDTEEAYVVHASLAGAKKEDVAVSWDAEKSELGISGVIHRPGDEELLKRLALDERKAGMFERKVRLGSRMTPAKVDADGITAKLEDGVLRIEVPKEDGEFVEVKKVDVE